MYKRISKEDLCLNKLANLTIALMIVFNSSLDGTECAPTGNTKLIGSNKRDSERDKYAFSNGCNDDFNADSGLHK